MGLWRDRTMWTTLAFLVVDSVCAACPSLALPRGRAWAPARVVGGGTEARMSEAQLGFVDDSLVLVTAIPEAGEGGGPSRWTTLAWCDSSWRQGRMSGIAAYAGLEPIASSSGRAVSAFLTHNPQDPAASPLLVAEVHAGGLGLPDTALHTTAQRMGFGVAMFDRRRWVVRSQQKTLRIPEFVIRTAYSDTAGRWHELPARGEDETMCAVAALGAKRALVVYAGRSGLRWAVAQGAAWGDSGVLDDRPSHAQNPRLVRDSNSTVWCLWTEKTATKFARFASGRWSPVDSLTCYHRLGEEYWSSWTAMSDDGGRPAFAWGDRGIGDTRRDVLCLSMPTGGKWAQPEEVPGSDGAAIPSLARDTNGDVWLAWQGPDDDQPRFAHSYVAVTCGAPISMPAGSGEVVSWQLDAPAPGSRWTVLRSLDAAVFTAVATLSADEGTHMSWACETVPPGHSVYRIRRESLDARYSWTSPPSVSGLEAR